MLSEFHHLKLKLCSQQYNKKFLLPLMIVVPQLSGGWQHNYSSRTRQAGCTNEQSMYYLMPMTGCHQCLFFVGGFFSKLHSPCLLGTGGGYQLSIMYCVYDESL
jgi:hypothetical protein